MSAALGRACWPDREGDTDRKNPPRAGYGRGGKPAGDLTLDWDTLTASTDPDQQLVVWTAEPGTPSHDGLRLLASWVATHQEAEHAV